MMSASKKYKLREGKTGFLPSLGKQRQSWKAAWRNSLSSNKVEKEQRLARLNEGPGNVFQTEAQHAGGPVDGRESEAGHRREAPRVRSADARSSSEPRGPLGLQGGVWT